MMLIKKVRYVLFGVDDNHVYARDIVPGDVLSFQGLEDQALVIAVNIERSNDNKKNVRMLWFKISTETTRVFEGLWQEDDIFTFLCSARSVK